MAQILHKDHSRTLENKLAEFERDTNHQIAVLTIPSLQGESIEDFSIRVAESWRIGQKGVDNGVILIIALKDRKLRIEVGYGLEGAYCRTPLLWGAISGGVTGATVGLFAALEFGYWITH